MAPGTARSGKQSWGPWRLPWPQGRRQPVVAWAAAATRQACWAQVYAQQQRAQGTAHQAAVRAVACTGSRILSRCGQIARHTMPPCLSKRATAVAHHSCTTWRMKPAKA